MADNYAIAFPILKEFGLKAYFFIIVSKVGTSGYMSWEQLKELNDEIKESKMILVPERGC